MSLVAEGRVSSQNYSCTPVKVLPIFVGMPEPTALNSDDVKAAVLT